MRTLLPICLLLGLSFLFVPLWAADDFRGLLDDAVQKGVPEVVIPPGVYRIKPLKDSTHVTIRNAQNLKIVATGVTLICERLTRALSFENCQNVTLQGLTIDYDPLPFTQGTVVAVAEDLSSIDIRIHDGYPVEAYSRIDICDPQTRFRKRGMPFMWGTHATVVGDRLVRISFHDIGKTAQMGDLASLSTGPSNGGAPHAVNIESCQGMVFENVTIFSAPGFGIMEHDGEGGMRYTHCRVVPGPPPAGATEERLLSSSWDAIQSDAMKKGPLIEQSEIRSAGDDSWSIQSSDYVVLAVDGPTVIIGSRDEFVKGPVEGDRLVKSLESPAAQIVTRERIDRKDAVLSDDVSVKLTSAWPYSFWSISKTTFKITVAGTFPFAVGDSLYCPDRHGDGFIFRNNKVHSSGRILIKGSDGLIENNDFLDTHSGVTVAPEVPGEAAVGVSNLIIRGNRFVGTGYFCPSWDTSQAGCISITAPAEHNKLRPPGIFQNLLIENNLFEDINGPAIVIFSGKDVIIRNNTFCQTMKVKPTETGGSYGIDHEALIWLGQCEATSLTGNRVYEPGEFLKKTVAGQMDPNFLQQAQAGVEIETGTKCPQVATP